MGFRDTQWLLQSTTVDEEYPDSHTQPRPLEGHHVTPIGRHLRTNLGLSSHQGLPHPGVRFTKSYQWYRTWDPLPWTAHIPLTD